MLSVNKPKYFHFISLLLILTTLSCNKNKVEPENSNSLKENSLHFIIQSVQDIEDESQSQNDNKSKSSSRNPIKKNGIVSAESEIVDLNGIDAIMTISEKLPDNYPDKPNRKLLTVKNESRNKSTNGNMARVVSQLPNDVTYKIVLYKADANGKPTEFVDQADGKVGAPAVSIPGYRNTKYRWYAYTYNNSSPLTKFNANQTNIPVVPSNNNQASKQDFAFATGVITTGDVVGGNSSINNIVLTRKTARIIVEVNSRGMFGAISYASPRFKDNSGLFKSEFKLADSSYQNSSQIINSLNVFAQHESGFSVPVGTDSVPEADWKRRYTFYTPANGTSPVNLQVSLDTLKIKSERLTANGSAPTSIERQFLNRTFSFPNFTPLPGKSYFISIKLVESAVTIENTNWARANVYRNANGKMLPGGFWEYRFRYDNLEFNSANSVPSNTDMFTDDIYNIDGKNICERIYPEGVWDLPTKADFDRLNNYSPKSVITSGLSWYMRITPQSASNVPSQGYPDNYLKFVPTGYKENSTSNISEYFPNNLLFRETKGYWRTLTPNVFAQFNYSNLVNNLIATGNYPSPRNINIRCIRKKS